MKQTEDKQRASLWSRLWIRQGGHPEPVQWVSEERDTPPAGRPGAPRELKHTKLTRFKMNLLIPALGIALVGGGFGGGKSYLAYEEKTRSEDQFVATLEGLMQNNELCRVLALLRNGDSAEAAGRLDELLSARIVRLDAQLASASPRTRTLAGISFNYIAQMQPRNTPDASGLPADLSPNQITAQKILARALTRPPPASVLEKRKKEKGVKPEDNSAERQAKNKAEAD